MSNHHYEVPDGFTLDQNSGQYYKETLGRDKNGAPGTWYTWFYPDIGQYAQEFYPDENAQTVTQYQTDAAQTQRANSNFAAARNQTEHSAVRTTVPAEKKKKSPLLYFLPVATLVIGAAAAFIVNGGFGDNPTATDGQSRERPQSSVQSGGNGQTTNQDNGDNRTSDENGNDNQTAGQNGGSGQNGETPNAPDQTTPSANVSGVSISALVNTGYFAQQDDWVYYAHRDEHLYKKRVDGTEETELAANVNPSYIQVSGDWVYFQGRIEGVSAGVIHRIRTDGTQLETILVSTQITRIAMMQVDGDWIYFSDGVADGASYHKVRTDGTELTLVQENVRSRVILVGEWLYWGGGFIYRARPGEEPERFDGDYSPNTSTTVIVIGDLIYIMSRGIYTMNKDGSNLTRIYDESVRAINVSDDGRTIYFRLSDDSSLWKIGADGSGLTQLSTKRIQNFAVFGDWVYFEDFTDGGISRVRTDGSAQEKWA